MKIWKRIVSFFLKIFRKDTLNSGPYAITLPSLELGRSVYLELFIPPLQKEPWSLLILNDGQDASRLALKTHFKSFRRQHSLMIAAIHAGNRMQEYGTANILDYKKRGEKSAAYQQFIIKELLPYLHKNYPITAAPAQVGIAGFSLGGLSAIDLAWSYPKIFGYCGVFSGALWWRDKKYLPNDPDANRIIHKRIKKGDYRKQRFWFQAGTQDELSDRNNNGVIDAIDDTLDLMKLLAEKIPAGEEYLKYTEVLDGKHDPETWSKVFPDFLHWAFLNHRQKKSPH